MKLLAIQLMAGCLIPCYKFFKLSTKFYSGTIFWRNAPSTNSSFKILIMKKTIGIMGVTVLSFLSISVHAQQTQTWDPKKNPTVEAIISKYEVKKVAPQAELKTSDIFPVIGKYESATNADAASVTIIPDEQNKGIVWIEGLPQGRIKAMLHEKQGDVSLQVRGLESTWSADEFKEFWDRLEGVVVTATNVRNDV